MYNFPYQPNTHVNAVHYAETHMMPSTPPPPPPHHNMRNLSNKLITSSPYIKSKFERDTNKKNPSRQNVVSTVLLNVAK